MNCTICGHPDRASIDRALIAGTSQRGIAGRYGFSKSAVARHAKDHIAETIATARQALQIEHGGNLIDQVGAIKAETLAILNDVKGTDKKTALAALRRLLDCVELVAKVEGILRETGVAATSKVEGQIRDGTTINLTVSPEWARTRAIILQALEPFPEARVAVATALQSTMVQHAGA